MIGMMMAMSGMCNIGHGESMGGRLMSKKDRDQWAKDKIAKEKQDKKDRERYKLYDKKIKKKKPYKFNVTYSKGVNPVFKTQ